MSTVADAPARPLIGEAPPSQAGPRPEGVAGLREVPEIGLPAPLQTLRFSMRQLEFVFRARRELGEVFRMRRDASARPGGDVAPRPRPLAVHRQARAGAVADRRVAAAPDRRARTRC